MSNSLSTPLLKCHEELGGRLVEFAGYMLPVQYKGIIFESKAVRTSAGMFDVSHMARLRLTGTRVLEFLEKVTTNDVSSLSPLGGQYSMLPNQAGGVVDDVIVYKINDEEYRMVVNASNHVKDLAHLHSLNDFGVKIDDLTDQTAMIAVQGPDAVRTVESLSTDPDDLALAPLFGVVETTIASVPTFAARSGYTGEDGYELICPADRAPHLWHALVSAGVEPCGLGSRDVLRVEAGLPLYGHELTDTMSPISAGLGWVIGKSKTFIGSGPINEARTSGTPTKLQGVRLEGKRLPMIGMDVYVGDEIVGQVSSGIFSPLLECGCAFAFLRSDIKQGVACTLDMRGKHEIGTVVNKRFFKRL